MRDIKARMLKFFDETGVFYKHLEHEIVYLKK